MLIWHLSQSGMEMQRIAIFGKGLPGYGKAYGGAHPDLRLNVRDSLMNVTLDDGLQFADWARKNLNDPGAASPEGAFYRRRDFGRFVEQLIKDPLNNGVHTEQKLVTGLTAMAEGFWQIKTQDSVATARRVVLATGNPEPLPPFAIPEADVITSPWQGDWPEQISADDEIVIIGAGLTAMDALLILNNMGHQGPVRLVSPVAALPPKQAAWEEMDAVIWPRIETASQFFRFWRENLPDQNWETRIWQEHFEALRVGLSPAWQRMPAKARMRASAWLSRWWQPARYRAAPQTHAAAMNMIANDQLSIIADRATAVERNSDRLEIKLGQHAPINADKALLAIGAGRDPLVDGLGRDGLLAPDRIGIEIDRTQGVIGKDGTAIKGLYAVGPQTAFSRGDIIGATGVSREARTMAHHLMEQHPD